MKAQARSVSTAHQPPVAMNAAHKAWATRRANGWTAKKGTTATKYHGPSPEWRTTNVGVVGICAGCGQTYRAMGLSLKPGGEFFGSGVVLPDEWQCCRCFPRGFDRPGGKTVTGWQLEPVSCATTGGAR